MAVTKAVFRRGNLALPVTNNPRHSKRDNGFLSNLVAASAIPWEMMSLEVSPQWPMFLRLSRHRALFMDIATNSLKLIAVDKEPNP